MTNQAWWLCAACLIGCANDGNECAAVAYAPDVTANELSFNVDHPLFPHGLFVFESASKRTEVSFGTSLDEAFGATVVTALEIESAPGIGQASSARVYLYAQDPQGNVWHLGTHDYGENGVPDDELSWEAGVDGAQPGIVMHATQPPIGERYRQHCAPRKAETVAEVLSTDETVTVASGTFDHCVQIYETSRLAPASDAHRYYCPEVGLALTVNLATQERTELLDYRL